MGREEVYKGVWGAKCTATRETRRGGEHATQCTGGVLQNRTRETRIILFTDVAPTNSIQLIKREKEKGKKSERKAQTKPREASRSYLANKCHPTHRRGRSGLLWPGLRTAPSPAPKWVRRSRDRTVAESESGQAKRVAYALDFRNVGPNPSTLTHSSPLKKECKIAHGSSKKILVTC